MKMALRISSVVLVLAVVLCCMPALAFDREREGFVLGFGMGPSVAWSTSETDDESHVYYGIGTEFTMGYAFTGQIQVQYAGRSNWIHIYYPMATLSAGVTYYFRPEAPSLFITGGGGAATPPLTIESSGDLEAGGNAFAGAGYEWTPYWRVSMEYTRYWYRHYDRDFDEIRVVVGFLAY
jgi:hypothetical protein